MTVPDFYFVDDYGNSLPEEDGVQHVRQYGNRWRIHVDGNWAGHIVAESDNENQCFQRVGDGQEWELPRLTGFGGAVGFLTARLQNSLGQTVGAERTLHIRPASVMEKELAQMLEDIGTLAVQTASLTRLDISTPIPEDTGMKDIGGFLRIGRASLIVASNLIALHDTLQRHWPLIQQRPLKSIQSKLGIVRLYAAKSSPALMLKRKIEPHRTAVAGLVVEEHIDCTENRFLAYVLDEYLIRLAKAVIGQLDAALQQIPNVPTDFPVPAKRNERLGILEQNAISRSGRLKQKNELHKHLIAEKKARLQKTFEWASAVRKSIFLRDVRTPAHLPKASLRLTHSPHYGPVYARFVQCQTKLDGLGQVLFLLDALQQQGSKYAWNIYEIWCVAQIYSLLVTRLGLKPPVGERSLFERAELTAEGVDLPKNAPFKLVGKFGERKVEAELWYEKEYYKDKTFRPVNSISNMKATPDIVIKMTVDGVSYNYCLDAKYRDYRRQGGAKFQDDVYTIAYDKYKVKLEDENFKCGFILHTDSNADYWGEVGIRQRWAEISLNKPLAQDVTQPPAGHEYGGICLKPGYNLVNQLGYDFANQLEKLMQLMFHYHGPFRDTCLHCGCRLSPKDMQHDWNVEVRTSDANIVRQAMDDNNDLNNYIDRFKGTGVYCFCPDCGNFWVIQRCQASGHRLIKTSQHTCIHHPSSKWAKDGKWMYLCPTCGDDWEPLNSEKHGRIW